MLDFARLWECDSPRRVAFDERRRETEKRCEDGPHSKSTSCETVSVIRVDSRAEKFSQNATNLPYSSADTTDEKSNDEGPIERMTICSEGFLTLAPASALTLARYLAEISVANYPCNQRYPWFSLVRRRPRRLLAAAGGVHAGKSQEVYHAKTLWRSVVGRQCWNPVGLHAEVRVRI